MNCEFINSLLTVFRSKSRQLVNTPTLCFHAKMNGMSSLRCIMCYLTCYSCAIKLAYLTNRPKNVIFPIMHVQWYVLKRKKMVISHIPEEIWSKKKGFNLVAMSSSSKADHTELWNGCEPASFWQLFSSSQIECFSFNSVLFKKLISFLLQVFRTLEQLI